MGGAGQGIFEFHQPSQGDGRNAQQEGEAGGVRALPTIEEAGGEGAAGTGHPRHQGQGLGQSHQQSIAGLDIGKQATPGSDQLGEGQQQSHDDRYDPDGGDAAKGGMVVIGHQFLECQSRDQDRNGAQGDRHTQAGRWFSPLAVTKRLAHGMDHFRQVLPEIGDDGRDAAQLDHSRVGHTWIPPPQKDRHHLEMGGTTYGQKLRQTLDHPQNHGVPTILQQGHGLSGR